MTGLPPTTAPPDSLTTPAAHHSSPNTQPHTTVAKDSETTGAPHHPSTNTQPHSTVDHTTNGGHHGTSPTGDLTTASPGQTGTIHDCTSIVLLGETYITCQTQNRSNIEQMYINVLLSLLLAKLELPGGLKHKSPYVAG